MSAWTAGMRSGKQAAALAHATDDWTNGGYVATDGLCWFDGPPPPAIYSDGFTVKELAVFHRVFSKKNRKAIAGGADLARVPGLVCWWSAGGGGFGVKAEVHPRVLTNGQLAMARARKAKAARKARKAEYLTGRRLVWRRIEARHPQRWWAP